MATQEEQAVRILYAVLDDALDGIQYGKQTALDANLPAIGILEMLLSNIESQISLLKQNIRRQISDEDARRISSAVYDRAEGDARWLDEITSF